MPNLLHPTPSNTAILLCTYNGERHLSAQIQSLLEQSSPCTVLAFDDCSSDSTVSILRRFESDQFLVTEREQNLGYVKNFEAAIQTAVDAGYQTIALADQDDVWEHDRIERGLLAMQNCAADTGVLVHSDLSVIDDNDEPVAPSYFKLRRYRVSKERNLQLILGQNGVMGNTILMTDTLAKLALPFPDKLHVHDYWIAVIAELYGQRILLDDTSVQYRLHSDNASNSARKFNSSKLNPTTLSFWQRLLGRNYKLPFMEDSRQYITGHLLDNQSLPAISEKDIAVLRRFDSYLNQKHSRLTRALSMLKSDFLKPGLLYRIRFVFAMLFSNRYQ